MTTAEGLILTVLIAWALAAALYLYALDLRLVNFKWYRKSKGGRWVHASGYVEHYPRKATVVRMSSAWRQSQKREHAQ